MSTPKEKSIELKRRIYAPVLAVIKALDSLPKDTVSRRVSDQLLRSITSILANYIEGLSASSKKDFTNFLNHSLKSANESKVWVAILRDTGRWINSDASHFLKELEELSKIFASSILTLRGKK